MSTHPINHTLRFLLELERAFLDGILGLDAARGDYALHLNVRFTRHRGNLVGNLCGTR